MFDATPRTDLVGDLISFGSLEEGARNPTDKDLQRAVGCGRIVLSGSEKGTRIMDVFQESPIRIMFPRTGGAPIEEAVLINTAGGIAGGDRLECHVTALANASIAVTSQAAEKVYRALNEPARIATKLKACRPQSLPGSRRKQSCSMGRVSAARQKSNFLLERSWLPSSGLC